FHKLAAIRCIPAPLVIARLEDVAEDGAQTWHAHPDARRGHQPEDDAGDRRVDAGRVEAQPHRGPEEEVYRQAPYAETSGDGDHAQDEERETDRDVIQGVPVTDRHDQDRADVIEDRQGYEEQAQAVGNARTKERKPPDHERRIGSHYRSPAVRA